MDFDVSIEATSQHEVTITRGNHIYFRFFTTCQPQQIQGH